jgi:predicted Holliday junction resolvase-like endonuclease
VNSAFTTKRLLLLLLMMMVLLVFMLLTNVVLGTLYKAVTALERDVNAKEDSVTHDDKDDRRRRSSSCGGDMMFHGIGSWVDCMWLSS